MYKLDAGTRLSMGITTPLICVCKALEDHTNLSRKEFGGGFVLQSIGSLIVFVDLFVVVMNNYELQDCPNFDCFMFLADAFFSPFAYNILF
ncbi:1902_t:CDS:2 [Diversispora eburnea]|uniref:1902_t:CDS:1 n=1 Tax=Diversispora eburnea TaxID=1213867 RepID=A0A9N8VBB9_9GLOM|nr:1902_t:CDS:2 [Diversispora eburnea]